MPDESENLSLFHPLIRHWFESRIGHPTGVQLRAWPEIASGGHVLIVAPTGSGKTLAAFLWALDRLISGKIPAGRTGILYVSPLKALNNDIQRNLLRPLTELKDLFEQAGAPFPDIRALTRSGDTPPGDRRKMQRHPPEILITTPESLNLLLSSDGGKSILTDIETVILDEIHAVVGTKRGVHLITAVDRLVLLSGEFQRIALSATVRPLGETAEFVGGCVLSEHPLHFRPRPVSIVTGGEIKAWEVQVRFPEEERRLGAETIWEPLVDAWKRIVRKNRATLLFANSRRLCEKVTLLLNAGENPPLAYAHHGSLSREIRREVEKSLKSGKLKAIVATSSLELGIDIGSLDEVILVQAPMSVSSAIQRIGRSGHQVGGVSRGTFFPTHSMDLLEAAVLSEAVRSGDIEPVRPVEAPLDVLAQIIVSMTGTGTWSLDDLYLRIKASHPYRSLSRQRFDLVLRMLSGRYAGTRIRELNPLISLDRLHKTVTAGRGALQSLYLSGGTIPDRGYFQLRHEETGSRIGELDEEFVWEASVGQVFSLGAQSWKIARITHNDVFVIPAAPDRTAPPFWKAEETGRDFHLSRRIGEFLETADAMLEDPGFWASLQEKTGMDGPSCGHLMDFLTRQRKETGCPLPHRHHLVVETVERGPGGAPGNQIVLHTIWGGRVNRPYAMALQAAWEKRYGWQPELYVSDDCIVLVFPHEPGGAEFFSLVTPSNVEALLRTHLEKSGFFGARFRECAGRALLLPRRKFNERVPLWLSRLKSQKLLQAVMGYDDFPILLEAWRTCLHDEFDMEALHGVLAALESGEIRWSAVRTSHASPMALSVSWDQVNRYVYMDDRLPSPKASRLREDLLREAVFSPGLRPQVSRRLVRSFEMKRRRLHPGYSPDSPRDLLEWVKERLAIPLAEWKALLKAARRDHGIAPEDLSGPVADRLVRIRAHPMAMPLIVSLEQANRLARGLGDGRNPVEIQLLDGSEIAMEALPAWPEEEEGGLPALLGEWLRFYGPIAPRRIGKTLGLTVNVLRPAIEELLDSEHLVSGRLTLKAKEDEVCDAENLEVLLRLFRRQSAPAFEPLPIDRLPLFLALQGGILDPGRGQQDLSGRLEGLLCHPLAAEMWESDVLPVRLQPYDKSWLDSLIQESGLQWVGSENRKVAFCFPQDMDLMFEEDGPGEGDNGDSDRLFPDPRGRYDFMTLVRSSGENPSALASRLWKAVWQGRVSNDSVASLRKGIENRFRLTGPAGPENALRTGGGRKGPGRGAFDRWRGAGPFAGNWYRLMPPDLGDNLLESEERKKDRLRLLLDRYGILFRELLARELPPFQWGCLFRTLRIMELSGEILAGYFFKGIPGPQFMSRKAFHALQKGLPEDRIFWLNAADPASPCGMALPEIKNRYPRRTPTTHLVFDGHRLVLISRRNARELSFRVPPDDPRMARYLGLFHHLVSRPVGSLRSLVVEKINDVDAARSPYVEPLGIGFDIVAEYRKVVLYRKIG